MESYTARILEKIKEYEVIVLLRHQNSDMDALGAQFAMKEWLNLNFPEKKVYCIGENHQKYTKEFIPKSDTFVAEGKFLAICLDVNSIDRIDGSETFKKAELKICIDHHEYVEKNEFDLVYIDKNTISCCQVIAEILFDINMKLNTNICKYLYAGICSDSGNFYYPNTDYKTLTIAGKLLYLGNVDPYKDIHMLVGMKSFRDLEITNYLFSKTTLEESGLGYYINTIKDLEKLDLTPSAANEKISEFNRVEEIKIFLAASECEDHTYRCSIRSKTIEIVDVAKKYGGGGHKFACGVKGLTKEQLEKMKLELLNLTKE